MIERIKQEIEQRISDNTFGAKLELIDLLSFIESLEKSLPVEESEIDLDKEIDRFMESVNNEATIDETAKHFYDLGCRHAAAMCDDIEFERQRRSEEEPKIKGWVARDKANDLYFFTYKPHRTDGVFYSEISEDILHLNNDMFPELSRESDPIEVELTIHRV